MTTDAMSLVSRALPVLRAHAARADEEASFPEEPLQALRENGLLGLLAPREYGGAGASVKTFVDVSQALAGACLSTAQIWAMHCFQVDAVARYGSAELKADLLPRVAKGDAYIASVTSEVGGRADLFTAEAPLEFAKDRAVITRSAPVVTGGAHADGYLITMRAGEDASEHQVTLVYADRRDLDVQTSGEWNTLGMRATESVSMVLTGEVPLRNVVGTPGHCAEIVRESLIPLAHVGWAACWLGTARGALSELLRWFRKSGRFGADGQTSDLFHERLARVRVDLDLVSAYLARVVERVDSAREAGRPLAEPRTQLQLNTLKLVSSDLTFRAVDRMLQLAGLGMGYSKGSAIPLERHFRDLRAASLNHNNDSLWAGVGALAMLDPHVNLI
ncbi:acyl-CoA dehydrogenase family protein [Streptomyces sp. NPDC050619]|uniref:acyl-CoA dehydrogenase family protein n=1 Tax=Streptomyces sp. NPDC050619 TaxID=3157214 RepID=UPI0034261CD5